VTLASKQAFFDDRSKVVHFEKMFQENKSRVVALLKNEPILYEKKALN